MKQGFFVVIDGLGGSGKSTQIEMLKKRLPADAIFTHEPGGAPRAEKIRSILKEGDLSTTSTDSGQASSGQVAPLADFFLFWAARAEHMSALIRPALEAKKIVVSDRFDSSTFAMQVRGDEQKDLEEFFWQCRAATLGDYTPDAYIILDAGHSVAKDRRVGRREGEDRFDERAEDYQERVRAGYREFAEKVDGHIVDATRTPEAIHSDIWAIVGALIR